MSKYNPIDPQRNQAECLNKDISDFVSKAKLNDISEILDFEEEQFPRKEELRTQPVPSLLSMTLYYIFLFNRYVYQVYLDLETKMTKTEIKISIQRSSRWATN